MTLVALALPFAIWAFVDGVLALIPSVGAAQAEGSDYASRAASF